jgi:hypothetical protein
MSNTFYHRSPPTLLQDPDGTREFHWPPPYKPSPDKVRNELSRLKKQITNGVPLKKLRGWAYHDQFLRFLFTITASNAALLNLHFKGSVKLHKGDSNTCGDQGWSRCNDVMIESL